MSENTVKGRNFSLELVVGVFSLISILAIGYLAINLGGLDLYSSDEYPLVAEFNDVSGLQQGASVEIGGVKIGDVVKISLADSRARVEMRIKNEIQIQDDDIALIRTKGIIGDRYIKVSRGASEDYLQPGDVMFETEDVVDIEDIIGKLVHSFTGGDDGKKTAAVELD